MGGFPDWGVAGDRMILDPLPDDYRPKMISHHGCQSAADGFRNELGRRLGDSESKRADCVYNSTRSRRARNVIAG
jgi:hypothetical protein